MTSRNRDGFVLLAVVILLPLIGMAMVFLTRQTAQLAVATRQMKQDGEMTNLYLSAVAYIQANRQSLTRPDAPANQTLPMDRIASQPAWASIEISPSGSPDKNLILTIQLRNTPKPIQRQWTLRLAQTLPAGGSVSADGPLADPGP
jgi:hypothetical protein